MAEIVGLVANLLGPAIELGKCIVEPIKRQLNYLCCFISNMQNLRDEAKKLDDARVGLQMQVDEAKRNTNVIVPEVETWLENVNAIQADMSRVELEIPNVKSGCLTIKSHFSLSRKAKKMAEAIKELHDHCKFDHISQPALPAAMESIPLRQTYEIESRKHIEEEIMTTLREKNVNIMGICGMGGVGKTTMAKKIMKRVREEGIFDETLMAVVSQKVDMFKIQQEMAELLGLRLEMESLSARAHKLCKRLMDATRILIILDDLWERLKLEDLGIPYESGLKGCTILLTSRNRDALSAMNVEKIFEIQFLFEIEAWSLFRKEVGSCVDDHQELHSIARGVVKECKGLPIALVTVGVALKNKTNKAVWKDALQQLKGSNPTDIPDFLVEVYNPLKLSYDWLDSQQARSIFLLCCMFPEDYEIPVHNLTIYGWGLGVFEGVKNLEEASNRLCTLVERLKSRFLLLEGTRENHVKMHDIVRDVAIFIASKEGLIDPNLSLMIWPREQSYTNCTWISSSQLGERTELPLGLVYPNLRLLLLIQDLRFERLQVDDKFFEGMEKLNVLSINGWQIQSLPHTMGLMKNLRTLLLYRCQYLETISVVGELANLEILVCHGCHSIKELPLVIGRLKRLRLLEISTYLFKIPPGVISSLVGLEVLKMLGSFDKWEAEGKERKNAGLSELESLSNLMCLEIEIEDSTLVAQQLHLSSKIVKYDIKVGSNTEVHGMVTREKTMYLNLERETTVGNWVHKLLRSTEALCLQGEGLTNLDLAQAQNLISLALVGCSNVKNITSSSIHGTTADFPLLEWLQLTKLDNLEEISSSPSNNAFKNLKELCLNSLPKLKHLLKSPYQDNVASSICSNLSSVSIFRCHSLGHLFSMSMMAKDCLLQLESLVIGQCEMMEYVLQWSNAEENQKDVGSAESRHHVATFSKLKILCLSDMRNLATFCRGIESIEFPLLTRIKIGGCPKLKNFISSSGGVSIGHDHDDNDDDCLHFFCKPEVAAFGSLKDLNLRNRGTLWCHQIPNSFFSQLEELEISRNANTSLFSSSIVENLINLKELKIRNCSELVKVIEDGEEEEEEEKYIVLFPNLEKLHLLWLPKLKTFCNWRCALELPSVKVVFIVSCNPTSFTLGPLTTPNLESVNRFYHNKVMVAKDLNGLQRFLITNEVEVEEEEEEE